MAESLTPSQKDALSKLQDLLTDISDETYKDTNVLIKFLKARDFNEKKAASMIRKSIRWGKEVQIDTLLTDFKVPEVLEKYLPATHLGFSKNGNVVWYVPVGKFDVRGLLKSANFIYIEKYIAMNLLQDDQLRKLQSIKLKKPSVQAIGIHDLENISFGQMTHSKNVQTFIRFMMMSQDNYPETVEAIYVINAPEYFATIWSVLKKFIGSSLMKKISIYGQNGWKEDILKKVDAVTLPAFLGGNRTDPDGNPLCLTFVNHLPEPVPEKYFLEKNIEKLAQKNGVKMTRIESKSSTTEPIEIAEANSIINWEFELKRYDIGFGILFEATDGATEEMIPIHNIETELESYIGMYRCKKPGKYLVVFDNSYSWMHAKEIYSRIWVTNA